MEQNKEAKILEFIDSLTTTGKKTLDEGQVKGLIELLKKEKDLMNYAYYALMTQLRKDHAEIRYSALLTIHEIFMRSNKFRTMLEKDLSEFFELVVETNLDRPLPKPWPRAKDLKIKALELIKLWASAHGRQHFRLQDGLEYLKYCKKVDFNDMEARSVAQREQIQRIEEKKEKILNEKVLKIRSEMKEMTTEISNTVVQMESCFELLIPSATNDLFSSEDFETEIEELTTSSPNDSTFGDTLRDHGIYDLKKSITIEVKDNSQAVVKTNEDNLPIIENLNDLYKEMINRFLPMVTTWLKTLTKGNNCIDDLKKAIDLKQMIESVFKKYKDLKLKSNVPSLDTDDDDEDDFVEVKDKEGYEAEVKNTKVNKPSSQPSCSKVQTVAEKAYMWNFKHPEDNAKDPTSALSTLSKRIGNTATDESLPCIEELPLKQKDKPKSQKEELLNKAPVRPYDIDLYHWEEEKPLIPEVVKFDSLHNFWESKNEEENEALKEAQMASLRTRKIDFSGNFEPVKWSCRAPLPSGKLCPRKDRYKCPLHGKIIKRDDKGNPVDPKDVEGPSTSKTTAVPDWQDPELLKDIEATTGINLKLPPKKGKKKGEKLKNGLTNIKIEKTTPKERMTKKIMKRYKHYAKKLDETERKKFNDKFGDQWNYY